MRSRAPEIRSASRSEVQSALALKAERAVDLSTSAGLLEVGWTESERPEFWLFSSSWIISV